ncbi:MAG: sulfotransferase, partial [Planctomycetales bacterium]|nr:sulfotransferase [Planctomycetales bacterium]
GRLAEAQDLCRQALATNPNNADAYNLLGVISGGTGNHKAAADYMRQAAAVAPNQVAYRRNYISALLAQNQFQEAAAAAQEAIELFPNDAKLTAFLGAAKGAIGDLDGGIKALESACQAEPAFATAHFNLGELYRRAHRSDDAIKEFKATLELNPQHADALNNLAGLQLDRGDFLDGLYSIKRLLELRPRSAQAYTNLSTALVAGGDVHQGIVALRNAITLAPDEDRIRAQLSSLLINIGDLDEAEEIIIELRKKLDDNPILKAIHARIHERRGKLDEAWELLEQIPDTMLNEVEIGLARATVLEQRGDLEGAAKILEDVLACDETLVIDGIGVQFMLGQIYDSLERYDEAFAMYREGNKHRLDAFPDLEQDTELGHFLNRLMEGTSPELFAQCPTSGLETNRPIFIVGMPRSGTSLMEQILSNHAEVHGAGELSTLGDVIRDTYQSENPDAVLEIVDQDPSGDFGCLLPKDWLNMSSEGLAAIGQAYLEHIDRIAPGAARITDKMPFNFMMLAIIHKVFPNAKIIHTRRNAIDTCLSCFFQNFTAGSKFAFDLEQSGRYYRCYEKLMAHWRDTLNIPFLTVDYEELVESPAGHIRAILDYCELPWDENCLNTHKSKRVVRTASYQQVRKPIYKRSAGRWKHYERHLGPLFNGLGIDPSNLTA